MLFYTSIFTNQLPQARVLALGIKHYNPTAKFYVLLCDRLPTTVTIDTKPFDSFLFSHQLQAEGVSGDYWQFVHTPEALRCAVKAWGAMTLLAGTGEDKIVYIDPGYTVTRSLKDLDKLLEDREIVIAPHPNLRDAAVDPRESAYDPGFLAVRNRQQGADFLQRWYDLSMGLWRSKSGISTFSYNRLLDSAPALYDSCCILQRTPFGKAGEGELNANGARVLGDYPCQYAAYDNGTPIPNGHRSAARKDAALRETYGHTNPFLTLGGDTLYAALTAREQASTQGGLYWEEYQFVVNSTSYKLGKKLVDTAQKLLPMGLVRKLRSKTNASALLPETASAPVDITPIALTIHEEPTFSVILQGCTDFTEAYTAIRSVADNAGDVTFEIILDNYLSEEDTARLTETVTGLILSEAAGLKDLLDAAKGRYALLATQHTSLPADFFTASMAELARTEAAMAQTKVIFTDGKIHEAGGVILQSGQRISYGFGLSKDLGRVRYDKEVDCVNLNGTLLDMEAYHDANVMDESLSPLYELADLSMRLRSMGLKTMYLPGLELSDRRSCTEDLKPFAPGAEAYPFSLKWTALLKTEHIADEALLFYGRDRSQGKLTIFAVDDRIPCYDLSAGDRNTYQYYETMAQMGYNLKIVGDDYARQEPYATKLERMGIEVVAADGRGEVEYREFLRDYGKFVDAAYLNRPNNLAKYTEHIKKYNPAARIVYCCHDLHFLRELREHEVNGNHKEAERVRNYAKEEIARMDAADVIFDVSAYEKSILDPQLKHARVEVNPIFIYREFPEFRENFADRKDLLFVGSFKHPGNLDGVAWLCKDIMPAIHKALPEVKLHLVGAHPTPEIKALANDHVIVHGFLSDEALADMYSTSRLSLVPLRFGAGVKGKVLEAMYHGLPIVSTSIGTEGIVDIEQCMENTDGAEAFAGKVIELYHQTDVLTEMGRTNWQYVQDHLGVEPAMELFRRSFEV